MITNAIAAALVLIASHERRSDEGHTTKYGERFNPNAFTCATWLYPSNAVLKVTEIHNHFWVKVRVVDVTARRFNRRIDLSPKAFEQLDGLALGLADVRVEQISP